MDVNKFPKNGPVDSWLFLPLARRVGLLLHACGLTPNAVTTLSLLAGVSALLCVIWDQPVGAMALFVVFYVLDCADGIMARMFGQCSDFGEVFDYLKDAGLVSAGSLVVVGKMGGWWVPAAQALGLYLIAWEGVMNCRAHHRRHGHFDFYSDKVRRRLFRLYLIMMWLCYRIGRPIVNWPLHWFGSGEIVVLSLFVLHAAASGP